MSLLDSLKNLFKGAVKEAANAKKTTTVLVEKLPQNAEEITALVKPKMQNPYFVAAYTVAALCRFPESREDCYAMLNVLKGPEPLSNRDKEFIRDRFMDGKDYVPRSYFVGATPENNYTPKEPLNVKIIEQSNSRDNAGYISLYVECGGADNPRLITLRQKASTQEWFLHQFEFLLAGIKIPKSEDKWA